MIDPQLQSDIENAEGCKLTAYPDTEGVWTIGWGHELPNQDGSARGLTWTQDQADDQLLDDISIAQAFARGLTEWQSLDTDCRRNALTELCFEMQHRWLLFKNTRAALLAQNWKGAHDGLLASLWATQVHSTRANRLADYLLTGAYPA